jgi:hypothetical protein
VHTPLQVPLAYIERVESMKAPLAFDDSGRRARQRGRAPDATRRHCSDWPHSADAPRNHVAIARARSFRATGVRECGDGRFRKRLHLV